MMLSARNNLVLSVFVSFLVISGLAQGAMPRRIVSLAPSITEALYLLGVEDQVVGVTVFCNYPPAAKQKEKVGTILEPNIEKIVSLSPDLVVATKEGNDPQTITRLEALGLNVAVFESSRNFADIAMNFLRLGKLVDREDEANEILEEAKKRVELVQEKIKGLPRPKVFWEVGAVPLFTVSGGAFANEFIRLGGGVNIASDAAVEYPLLSREEVLRQNPDVIILVTMGDVTLEEKRNWQKFKDLEAVKSDRIYIVDADLVCRPSPLTFTEGLLAVAKLLHPEVFEE